MDKINRLTSDFRTWEELNEYVGMKRSEPFEDYFKPMQISGEQKKRRGMFADDIEEEITYLLAFLFYMKEAVPYTDDALQIALRDVRNGYIKAYGTPDEYITERVYKFSDDIYNVTERHLEDPYYVSADRARLLAENEANTALNHKEYVAATQGHSRKQWITIIDGKERPSHGEVANEIIPIGSYFYVGNSVMLYPKDTSMGASEEEIANCRCSIRYLK